MKMNFHRIEGEALVLEIHNDFYFLLFLFLNIISLGKKLTLDFFYA